MQIVTWNVNGLRSILRKGLEDYLNKQSPDILCLQEIKANLEDVEDSLVSIKKDYEVILNPAKKKGYSGTAIFFKRQKVFEKCKYNLQGSLDKFDDEGRLTILENEKFILYNGYFPNGQRDHSRVDYKLEFSELVLKMAAKNKKDKIVIITGDLNTAHQEIDLKNPKANINSTGFLPNERAFIDKMISKGFVDVYRQLYPNKKDAYTWWTYRSNCREKNVGWRLDYFFVNEDKFSQVRNIQIQNKIMGSDHCPVLLEIEL